MRKFKMLALAMALAFVASLSSTPAAAVSCETQCHQGYRQCLIICSKNPCLISCEDQLRYCLNGCGSSS